MRFRSRADDGFAPRYRQLAECLGALEFPEMPLMSEAYVNYALHADGTLFELLEAEEEIGLISSQPAAPLLQTLFGLRVREYAVPQRAVDNESLADTGHFPGRFTELCAILRPGGQRPAGAGGGRASGQNLLRGDPAGRGHCSGRGLAVGCLDRPVLTG